MDIDHKKVSAIGKKIRAELEKLLQIARDAGTKRPMIYVEAESGIHVLDMDHPAYGSAAGVGSSQPSIVFSIYNALPAYTDTGAW